MEVGSVLHPWPELADNGAAHLLQCLHKYLRIIRRFQRGYYAIFLLILLWLPAAAAKW